MRRCVLAVRLVTCVLFVASSAFALGVEPDLDSKIFVSSLVEAKARYGEGDIAQAMALVDRAIAAQPKRYEAHVFRVALLLAQGRSAQASDYLAGTVHEVVPATGRQAEEARRALAPLVQVLKDALADPSSGNLDPEKDPSLRKPERQIGDPAPELDVQEWIGGNPVNRFVNGDSYLIELWAAWCRPCHAALPILEQLHRDWNPRGVKIVAIDTWPHRSDPDENRKWAVERAASSPYSIGLSRRLPGEGGTNIPTKSDADWMVPLRLTSVPSCVLVGRNGQVLWQGHPFEADLVMQNLDDPDFGGAERIARKRAEAIIALNADAFLDGLLPDQPNKYYVRLKWLLSRLRASKLMVGDIPSDALALGVFSIARRVCDDALGPHGHLLDRQQVLGIAQRATAVQGQRSRFTTTLELLLLQAQAYSLAGRSHAAFEFATFAVLRTEKAREADMERDANAQQYQTILEQSRSTLQQIETSAAFEVQETRVKELQDRLASLGGENATNLSSRHGVQMELFEMLGPRASLAGSLFSTAYKNPETRERSVRWLSDQYLNNGRAGPEDLNVGAWEVAIRSDATAEELKAALKWSQESVRRKPEASYYDTLAVLHFKRGDKSAALRSAEKALSIAIEQGTKVTNETEEERNKRLELLKTLQDRLAEYQRVQSR